MAATLPDKSKVIVYNGKANIQINKNGNSLSIIGLPFFYYKI